MKESKEAIRPHFTQRLTGTLADVIARHAQQEAAIQQGRGSHSQQHDRMPEIIGLLQTALQVPHPCLMSPALTAKCLPCSCSKVLAAGQTAYATVHYRCFLGTRSMRGL